jgi:predicted ATPase
MLTEIRLDKFKAFKELQQIPMKKITLLYGPNSAGKSSIIQSLLLLKQTMSEIEQDNSVLITKGKMVNLGNYREMVYSHDIKEKITIYNEFENVFKVLYASKRIRDTIQKAGYETVYSVKDINQITLDSIKVYINNDSTPFAVLEKTEKKVLGFRKKLYRVNSIRKTTGELFEITYLDKDHELLKEYFDLFMANLPNLMSQISKEIESGEQYLELRKSRKDSTVNKSQNLQSYFKEIENMKKELQTMHNYDYDKYYLDVLNLAKKNFFSIDGFLIGSVTLMETEDDKSHTIISRYQRDILNVEELIYAVSVGYKSMMDSIIYLGPLREYPERHYIFSGVSPTNVGKSGKFTSDLLFLNEDLKKEVNEWLKRFGIDYSVIIKNINDDNVSDVYSMRLNDEKNQISVSPLDVGFGISQILPIIVQSLISKNSIICIEQPEIHIHPRLQTVFGSFISEVIDKGNQFIIETHSEHIILRLKKLIREGKLKNDDVSVIYVDRTENGSKCLELRLDKSGNFIDDWPDGFFEDGYDEVFS